MHCKMADDGEPLPGLRLWPRHFFRIVLMRTRAQRLEKPSETTAMVHAAMQRRSLNLLAVESLAFPVPASKGGYRACWRGLASNDHRLARQSKDAATSEGSRVVANGWLFWGLRHSREPLRAEMALDQTARHPTPGRAIGSRTRACRLSRPSGTAMTQDAE